MVSQANDLESLFPRWDRMHTEIQRVLIGAERLWGSFIDDESVPRMYLASPYILALEREFIQFYKHKFPKYLRHHRPDVPLDTYDSTEPELKAMLTGSERIGLGHFVNWMTRLGKASGDELMGHLDDFTSLLDPDRRLFNKATLQLLSEEILVHRKYCVHISRVETWPDTKTCKRIRGLVLFKAGNLSQGLLPAFIELESNVLAHLGIEG